MSTATADAPRDDAPATGGNLYVAFIPWLVFSFVTHHDTLLAGSVVALAAALFLAARSGPKLPEIAAILAFTGFTVAAVVVDASTAAELTRYGRAIAAGVLALMAFGSLLGTPFTEQYAREQVPREVWGTPAFRAVNRRITAMWGCVFALMVPAHVLAGAIDTQHANLFLNWLVPVALVVWAVHRTQAITDGEAG
jgi:hypothetical protein